MADLIKKIKIKKQDGTFTDYIPIGAEASNINVDGESVVTKLNKTPYYYDNVADMKADTRLKNGDMAITLGYYTANDGGDGKYRIVSGDYEDDGENYHKINNNLYAELIINGKTLTVIEDLNSENKYKYRYKYSNNMVDNSFYVNNKIITNYDNIADLSVNIYLRESGSFTHIMDLINIYKQIQVQKLVLPLHLYYDNGYGCEEMNHSEFLNTVRTINNIIPIKVLKIHCTDTNFSTGLIDNNEYITIIEDLIDELSFLEVDTLILYNEAQYYYTNTTVINSITIPTLEHFKEKNLKVSISMSNTISVLYTNPELINAMDIICCNEYPSLGHNVKESNYKDLSQYFNATIEVIKKIKRLYNKPFILSEIGVQDSWDSFINPANWRLTGNKSYGLSILYYFSPMFDSGLLNIVDGVWLWYTEYFYKYPEICNVFLRRFKKW